MKFIFEGEEFKISFKHVQPGTVRSTRCYIWKGGNGDEPWARGGATCDPSDTFSKEIGRKLALTRALKNTLHFPAHWDRRAFRTAAWKAYLGRKEKAASGIGLVLLPVYDGAFLYGTIVKIGPA